MSLHYKPRLRGKKLVRWWIPTPDLKNRGFIDSKDRPKYIYNIVAVPYGEYIVLAAKTTDTWRGTIIPQANWTSVTYGLGKFVSVSHGDISAYSNDGEFWIGTYLPANVNWNAVTFGVSRFIAVSTGINVAYSDNGEDWSLAQMPEPLEWSSVDYGLGKFVAVSYDSNRVAYSTNGITWSLAYLPVSEKWKKVAYGSGKFVAIAQNSNVAAYSSDGTVWTLTSLPSSSNWKSIAVSSNKWVAVANGDKAAYSTDGITWIETTMPESADWSDVVFFGDKFVAIARGSGFIAVSTNGTTWTKQLLPDITPREWISVTGTDEINQRVCISVIDETSSTSQAAYNTNYNTFRSLWPDRPLYVLRVPTGSPFYIPSGWTTNPNDYGPIDVTRDNGNATLATDWFSIAGLDKLLPGSKVGLFVDVSGSMTLASVQASYNLFQSKVSAAGLSITNVTNSNEDYITPFITMLE